jgi:hypothetical protein
MIQAFMENLNRDMKTLSISSVAHEVTLESLLFRIIVSISGQHEVWEAYLRIKINKGAHDEI